MEQVKFAKQQSTTAILPAFSQKFYKTVFPLWFNEIEITSRNTFHDNPLTLSSEKDS